MRKNLARRKNHQVELLKANVLHHLHFYPLKVNKLQLHHLKNLARHMDAFLIERGTKLSEHECNKGAMVAIA